MMDRVLFSVLLIAVAGCDKQPATTACMVNEDCPERSYCDAPLASTSDLRCVVAQPGVCRPEDDSTYDAPCVDHRDCKLRGFLCGSQTCTTFACITDQGFAVAPGDCSPGCTFGKRTYTCSACFCPSACAVPDASSADGPAADGQ